MSCFEHSHDLKIAKLINFKGFEQQTKNSMFITILELSNDNFPVAAIFGNTALEITQVTIYIFLQIDKLVVNHFYLAR